MHDVAATSAAAAAVGVLLLSPYDPKVYFPMETSRHHFSCLSSVVHLLLVAGDRLECSFFFIPTDSSNFTELSLPM
jgi:hypothetical protein